MSAPCSNGRNRMGGHHGVVAHQGQAVAVGHVGQGLVVEHVVLRVGHRFDVHRPRVRPDGRLDRLGPRGVDEGDVDAQPLERLPEQRERTAVQGRGRNDMLPGVGQVEQGHADGLLPAAEPQRAHPAFEGRQALLEHVGRGVHQPGVYPAHLLQGKEVGRVLRIAEAIAGGLVDGHGAGAGRGVGLLAGVQRERSQPAKREIVLGFVRHGLWFPAYRLRRGCRSRRSFSSSHRSSRMALALARSASALAGSFNTVR